jgi:mRNA interferase MazF
LKGKIVLIPFPFTDLSASKLRPALVIHEGSRDLVVAFISSRLPSVSDLGSIVVGRDHKDFELTGLKVASVIRLDKVATVLKEMVVGEIGSVGDSLKKEVNSQLSKIYLL